MGHGGIRQCRNFSMFPQLCYVRAWKGEGVHGRVEKSPEEPGDRRGGCRGEIFVAVGRGQIRGRAGGGMFSQM